MRTGADLVLRQQEDVEVADMLGQAVIDGHSRHLVEVAVVEPAVPNR
jgi:hypothetical protein